MARRPHQSHSPAFKAKVALEALRGDKTVAELCDKYELYAIQINDWKTQLSKLVEAAHVVHIHCAQAMV